MMLSNEFVTMTATPLPDRKVRVIGKVKNASMYSSCEVVASKPIDRRTSYSGSGLPWPCGSFAFEGTPSRVVVDASGEFDAIFAWPNAYYAQGALTRIPPSIFVVLAKSEAEDPIVVRMELSEEQTLTVRSLTHRHPRHEIGAMFYDKEAALNPIPSSAEAVMRTIKEYKETGRVYA